MLLVLALFGGLLDHPELSDPVYLKPALVEYQGTIKANFLLRHDASGSATDWVLPLDWRFTPVNNVRVGIEIPFVWRYPATGGKRVGIGNISFDAGWQFFNIAGSYFMVGTGLGLPTQSETLGVKKPQVLVDPYLAYTFSWGMLSAFAQAGLDVPAYDLNAGKLRVTPDHLFWRGAVRIWPIRFLAGGVEVLGRTDQADIDLVPTVSVHVGPTWDITGGAVLPLANPTATSSQFLGIRVRL